MSVRIRLKRMGSRNRPFYRIVAADSRSPRDGKCIEELGAYRPMERGDQNVSIDLEKVDRWIANGAQPTDTIKSFIRKARRAAAAASDAS